MRYSKRSLRAMAPRLCRQFRQITPAVNRHDQRFVSDFVLVNGRCVELEYVADSNDGRNEVFVVVDFGNFDGVEFERG